MTNACQVVPWLVAQGPSTIQRALAEKAEAVASADKVAALLGEITTFPSDGRLQRHVLVTAAYAQRLFRAIEAGWTVMIDGYTLHVSMAAAETGDSGQRKKFANSSRLCTAAAAYFSALNGLEDLRSKHPDECPTLYDDQHWACLHPCFSRRQCNGNRGIAMSNASAPSIVLHFKIN